MAAETRARRRRHAPPTAVIDWRLRPTRLLIMPSIAPARAGVARQEEIHGGPAARQAVARAGAGFRSGLRCHEHAIRRQTRRLCTRAHCVSCRTHRAIAGPADGCDRSGPAQAIARWLWRAISSDAMRSRAESLGTVRWVSRARP